MRRVLLAPGLLLIALVLAGCAAEEGSPDPTPTANPTSSATDGTASASATNTSSASTSASVTPRASQTFDINIQGNTFVDGTKTIQKGDTVRWTQKDSSTHTVTSDDGSSFDSGNMIVVGPTSTFSNAFDAVGEFAYHCEIHSGMKATITVVEALPA